MFEVRTNAVRKIERQKRIVEAAADRKSGMTVNAIAAKMGVSRIAIEKYLRDERLSVSSGIKLDTRKATYHRTCLNCGTKIRVESPNRRCCSVCNTNARGAMV